MAKATNRSVKSAAEGMGAWALSAVALNRSVERSSDSKSRAAGAAEPPSLEALFRNHLEDVYRIVSRLLGPGAGRADIEDVTQQVFLAAHRALPKFRGESKVTTWLYGIASKTVLMHLRSRRRHRRLVGALEQSAAVSVGWENNVERSVESRRKLAEVWRCLMRIKPKKRIVFVLHEIEGLSGKQIAQMLEIKEATVWTRLHHARIELLKGLNKERP